MFRTENRLYFTKTLNNNNNNNNNNFLLIIKGGSNMTGTDLYVNKLYCAAAVRP